MCIFDTTPDTKPCIEIRVIIPLLSIMKFTFSMPVALSLFKFELLLSARRTFFQGINEIKYRTVPVLPCMQIAQ